MLGEEHAIFIQVKKVSNLNLRHHEGFFFNKDVPGDVCTCKESFYFLLKNNRLKQNMKAFTGVVLWRVTRLQFPYTSSNQVHNSKTSWVLTSLMNVLELY